MESSLDKSSAVEDSVDIKVDTSEVSDRHELDKSDTVHETGPVDDRSAPRQKRKRTSAEDQAILEAAYQRDPKPDKTARLEIVKQVALGEKEVQIWFQNRRQSSRRKAKPLEPYEIAQYHVARYGVDASYHPSAGPEDVGPGHYTRSGLPSISRWVASSSPSLPQIPPMHLERGDRPTSFGLPSQTTASASFSSQQQPPSSTTLSSFTATPTDRVRKSRVRLSMSCEGNASITTKDGSSPSPQKPQSIPPNGPVQKEADGAPIEASLRTRLDRSMSGRSRDSRAWEFWCDKESRSELEDKAEKDANGSAADAIGLLRSASGRNILGPVSTKRNSLLQKQPGDAKRSRVSSKEHSLHRSSTSHGRLQGASQSVTKPKFKQSESAVSVYIPGNESDKENWSPGDRRDHEKDVSTKNRHPERTDRKVDPEADAEIAAFMRSGRESTSLSSDDDLNCVQGLLSLSRGGR